MRILRKDLSMWLVLFWLPLTFFYSPERASAEEPKETLQPLDERILGVWQQMDAGAEGVTVELTRDRLAWAIDDRLDRVYPVLGQIDQSIVYSWWGSRQQKRFELEGETLTIETRGPSLEIVNQRYARLASRPTCLDPKPLILGDPTRSLAPQRLKEIRKELEARGQRDQAVRQGGRLSPEGQDVDRDNTAYLKALVVEIGWIDDARFGSESALAAFLIVQHSGDLPLMLAALPELEKKARESDQNAVRYVWLYDRTQLRLGRKQRYGSQLRGSRGDAVIAPLEDPGSVDAWRAELGLRPLGDK